MWATVGSIWCVLPMLRISLTQNVKSRKTNFCQWTLFHLRYSYLFCNQCSPQIWKQFNSYTFSSRTAANLLFANNISGQHDFQIYEQLQPIGLLMTLYTFLWTSQKNNLRTIGTPGPAHANLIDTLLFIRSQHWGLQ